MVIGRVARRSARAEHVRAVVGTADTQAALDLLELVDFAWHDCYGQLTPPDEVIDDILTCSRGDLTAMVRAARQAVEDARDLRLSADAIRAAQNTP